MREVNKPAAADDGKEEQLENTDEGSNTKQDEVPAKKTQKRSEPEVSSDKAEEEIEKPDETLDKSKDQELSAKAEDVGGGGAYQLNSDEENELFAHAERSSGSEGAGDSPKAADRGGLNRLEMSEHVGTKKPSLILDRIDDSNSITGGRAGDHFARQASASMHVRVMSTRNASTAQGSFNTGKRRDSVLSGLRGSAMLSHGGASGTQGGFGAQSQYGRSSTGSFMSLSRSVTKIMDKRSNNQSRVFL